MLTVKNLEAGYDGTVILRDVNLEVKEGLVVSVVGSNGAGKTTLMRAISGLISPMKGEIIFNGERIDGLPGDKIVPKGIALVPEGRHIFDRLSVYDNLRCGAYSRKSKVEFEEDIERMFTLFPILKERRQQKAGTFSGGQQQMLAIARGLMSRPKLLILDEPSLGLSPNMVESILSIIVTLREQGMTVILVEQNTQDALELADFAYVIQTGKVVLSGTGKEMLESDMVRKAYLGM